MTPAVAGAGAVASVDGTFGAPRGMNQRPLNCSRPELCAGWSRVRKRGWVRGL